MYWMQLKMEILLKKKVRDEIRGKVEEKEKEKKKKRKEEGYGNILFSFLCIVVLQMLYE